MLCVVQYWYKLALAHLARDPLIEISDEVPGGGVKGMYYILVYGRHVSALPHKLINHVVVGSVNSINNR